MAEISTEAVEASEIATRFVIDGRSSRFTVKATATGLLAKMGQIRTDWNPRLQRRGRLRSGKARGRFFTLVVKTSSLGVQDDISDKDRREIERLMNEEVLETTKFPEIVFDAPDIGVTKMSDMLYSATLSGELTLHGVTRKVTGITARVAVLGSMLRASGDFSLNQTDYNIKLISVAGGALKLKDDLKFSFEIVARKQE